MILDLQMASSATDIPPQAQFAVWATAALQSPVGDEELTVRVVDEAEIQDLNRTYRGKDKPTNVLSFPADLPDDVELHLLGDLIICAGVVAQEAKAQGKAIQAHWAHMVIHGTLHLQGYDHIDPDDAEIMEQLEIDILARQGVANPYWIDDTQT